MTLDQLSLSLGDPGPDELPNDPIFRNLIGTFYQHEILSDFVKIRGDSLRLAEMLISIY